MPEFRSSSDRSAARFTELTDPVLTVRQLGTFDSFARKQPGRVDSALVYATGSGKCAVFLPPSRPGRSDLTGRGYRSLYEIDMGIHHFTLSERLPCEEDAGGFLATIDVDWRVSAPERVVTSGLRDVRALVTPRIQRRLRRITRRFPLDSSSAAEAAAQEDLLDEPLAEDAGLTISCSVQLDLDEAGAEQKGAVRQLGYRHGIQEKLLVAADDDAELASKKAAFYQYYLQRGGVEAWALQVAQHPEDLPKALEQLNAEQQQVVRNQLDLMNTMIEGKHIEHFQLEGMSQAAADALTRMLRQTGGLPDQSHPQRPELDQGPQDQPPGRRE
ncbi:hypothetical protein [Streptacidiphilus rugosus]|uniref:hypothetical protein n=1 Tax=Streptacidiphilus rugosus TaxID=405783 RepID=UPI000565E65D|nr:hypothetical protein [Streptacidiphilus rugosus]